jgi:hypothetical protein
MAVPIATKVQMKKLWKWVLPWYFYFYCSFIFYLGLLLSQQEEMFGINMYDSLRLSKKDQIEVKHLVEAGLNVDDATLIIFEKRFGPLPTSRPVIILFS